MKGKELGRNLTQRKDGRYEAKYTDIYGKRHSIYGEKLKDVRLQLNEALYQKEHNIYQKDCKLTVDEWFKIWVETYRKPVIRETTLARLYRYYDSSIKAQLGNISLNQIKPVIIQSLYNNCIKNNLSKDSLIHIHSILKNMFQQAVINEYIMFNPCIGIKLEIKEQKKERRVLTVQEQKIFIDYAKKTRYYNLFVIMLLTGIRIGEALALTWNDVLFDKRCIYINKTSGIIHNADMKLISSYSSENIKTGNKRFIHEPKTYKSIRYIPLCDYAYELLDCIKKERIEGFDKQNLVFYTKTNLNILRSNVNTAITRIVNKINKENPDLDFKNFSAHTFRHTFATRCFEAGIPPKIIQNYLGHTSMNITMDLYTHISQELEYEQINRINEIL